MPKMMIPIIPPSVVVLFAVSAVSISVIVVAALSRCLKKDANQFSIPKRKVTRTTSSSIRQLLIAKITPIVFKILQIYHACFLKLIIYSFVSLVLPYFWITRRSGRLSSHHRTNFASYLSTLSFIAKTFHEKWATVNLFQNMSSPCFFLDDFGLARDTRDLSSLLELHVTNVTTSPIHERFFSSWYKVDLLYSLFILWKLYAIREDEKRMKVVTMIQDLHLSFACFPLHTANVLDMDHLVRCRFPFYAADIHKNGLLPSIRMVRRKTGEIVDVSILLHYLQLGPVKYIQDTITECYHSSFGNCITIPASILLFYYNEDHVAFTDVRLEVAFQHLSYSVALQVDGIACQEETRPARWDSVTVFAAIARLDLATPCLEVVYRLRN